MGWQQCCHPHGGNSYLQCTPRGRALDSTINPWSLYGSSNPSNNSTQKSYAEAAGPKGKHPQEAQKAPPPPTQQPPPPSRKRADPQSEPKSMQTYTTQFASPPHDEEEEPDDTPFFIQLAQLADDKKEIKSEDIATYMKFLLASAYDFWGLFLEEFEAEKGSHDGLLCEVPAHEGCTGGRSCLHGGDSSAATHHGEFLIGWHGDRGRRHGKRLALM